MTAEELARIRRQHRLGNAPIVGKLLAEVDRLNVEAAEVRRTLDNDYASRIPTHEDGQPLTLGGRVWHVQQLMLHAETGTDLLRGEIDLLEEQAAERAQEIESLRATALRRELTIDALSVSVTGQHRPEVDALKAEVMELRGWQTSARRQIAGMKKDREEFIVLEVLDKALHSREDS